MMIRCPKCGLTKDEAEYNRNKNNRNGRDTYCRECCRAKGRVNYEKRRLKTEEKRGQRKIENREEPLTIRCNECGVTKSKTEFYVRSWNKTGFETKCKQCLSKQGREYRRKNKDAKRAYYQRIKTERRTPADMTLMIKCGRCGEVKAATEFYARPLSSTGFDLKCKQCLSEQGREYRRKNVAARRAYYQRTRKARIEHMREYRKKNMPTIMTKWHEYEQKYPERVQAGDAVREAIKRKEILPARKCKCADCGKKAMDLHHESYAPDQWLVVVPLCRSCHKKRHMSSKV